MSPRNNHKLYIPVFATLAVAGMLLYCYYRTSPNSPIHLEYSLDVEKQCYIGKMIWRTNKPLNKDLTVQFCIPRHRQSFQSNEIVFYAPFNGEANQLKEKLPTWILPISEQYGFPIFAPAIITEPNSHNNLQTYYIYEHSGWFDIIIQIEIYLRKFFKLGDGKLIVIGESSGGSMAQRMAYTFPEHISRASWHGGSRFSQQSKTISTKMFASYNWHDYSAVPSKEFVMANLKVGNKIIQAELPPTILTSGTIERHASNKYSQKLIVLFATNQMERFYTELQSLPQIDLENHDYLQLNSANVQAADYILILYDFPEWDKESHRELRDVIWRLSNSGYNLSVKKSTMMTAEQKQEFIKHWANTQKKESIKNVFTTDHQNETCLLEEENNYRIFSFSEPNEIPQLIQK